MEPATKYDKRYYTQRQVMQLLNWTEEEYFWNVIDRADDYLRYFLPNDEEGQQLLKAQKGFWAWWRKMWQERDEDFLEACLHCPTDLANECYSFQHEGKSLSTQIRPYKSITRAAFAPAKSK